MTEAVIKFYLDYLEYPNNLAKYAEDNNMSPSQCAALLKLGDQFLSARSVPDYHPSTSPALVAIA